MMALAVLVAAAALIVVPKLGNEHDSAEEYCDRLLAVVDDGGAMDDELASRAPDEVRRQAQTLADLTTAGRSQADEYMSDHPERQDHFSEFASWVEDNCSP